MGALNALTRNLCILALAAGSGSLAATGPAPSRAVWQWDSQPLELRIQAIAQNQPNGYFILDSPVPLPVQGLEVFGLAPGREAWTPLAHSIAGEDYLLAMAPDGDPGPLEFLVVVQGRPWGRATFAPDPILEVNAPPPSPTEVPLEDPEGIQEGMDWGTPSIPQDRMDEDPTLSPTGADGEPLPGAARRGPRSQAAQARTRALLTKALGDPRFPSEKMLLEAVGMDRATWRGVRTGARNVYPPLARRLSSFHNRAFPDEPPTTPDYFLGK